MHDGGSRGASHTAPVWVLWLSQCPKKVSWGRVIHADSFAPVVSRLLPAHSSSQSQKVLGLQKLTIIAA